MASRSPEHMPGVRALPSRRISPCKGLAQAKNAPALDRKTVHLLERNRRLEPLYKLGRSNLKNLRPRRSREAPRPISVPVLGIDAGEAAPVLLGHIVSRPGTLAAGAPTASTKAWVTSITASSVPCCGLQSCRFVRMA